MVRTLKPSSSPKIGDLPAYDPEMDSFVTGPIRLELRPRAALLETPSGRKWDCYHNISPCDIRGHFLLLPTVASRDNWRCQAMTAEDCVDFVWLSRSSLVDRAAERQPPLLLTFNSARGGASQNHIHCHAWRSPPLHVDALDAEEAYAVVAAAERESREPIVTVDGVTLELLDYPCAVVRIRGGDAEAAGKALAALVVAAQELGLPHNIAALGSDTWVFLRNKDGERAPCLPAHRMGSAEMCGHFHCTSTEELELAGQSGTMEQALRFASASEKDIEVLWTAIAAQLSGGASTEVAG
eukprot:TRINITY_DN24420_c0_g1_i3.p1 TRINITY_DN24420_c0_g1~~TRINITY_DN24420_c0_g1_i3.p1  ORF type:complete len:297 (-),score=60.79 TRINITY_DN24420_c0_g1_i3:645-1535(-)